MIFESFIIFETSKGLLFTSIISALSIATSVPAPIAIPTSAVTRAGALNDFAWLFQDVGYTFGAQGVFILKEDLMRLNKILSGSRFNKDVLTFGGVNIDLDNEKIAVLEHKLNEIEEKYKEYADILHNNASILERLETTGRIKYETVKDLFAVGYTARASGLSSDIRKEYPYLVYDRLKFDSIVLQEGDIYARLRVRLSDLENSISIIRQCLANLPDGEIKTDLGEIRKNSWTLGYAEGQRRDIIHYVQTDDKGKIFQMESERPIFPQLANNPVCSFRGYYRRFSTC